MIKGCGGEGSKGINVSGVVFVVELRLMVVMRCIGDSRGIDIIMIVHVKYVLLLSSMYARKWHRWALFLVVNVCKQVASSFFTKRS